MSEATLVKLSPSDWAQVTIETNPFRAAGSAVCDPSAEDEDTSYITVGITKHVVELIRKFMRTGRSQHFAVVAPLGYGKSRSFAAAIQLVSTEYTDTIAVYVKFSSYRTEESSEKVQKDLVRKIVRQAARASGRTFKELSEALEVEDLPVLNEEILDRLTAVLPTYKFLVLIDEVEKLVESKYMPVADKTAILNLFKTWADRTKRRVIIGLALTSDAYFWILGNLTDVVQRFDNLPDEGFLEDETTEFVLQKCNKALGSYGKVPFSAAVIGQIHTLSEGIPRVIESIAHECWNRAAMTKKLLKVEDFAALISDEYGLVVKEVCRSVYQLGDKEIALIKDMLCQGGRARLRDLRDPDSPGYKALWRTLYRHSTKNQICGRQSGTYHILPEFMDQIMRRKYGGDFHGAAR